METCSAKVENGTVTQVIVGEASWATANLGGEWVQFVHDHDDSTTLVGVGDRYANGSFSRKSDLMNKIAARESAIAKLSALGLDADEITALLGS